MVGQNFVKRLGFCSWKWCLRLACSGRASWRCNKSVHWSRWKRSLRLGPGSVTTHNMSQHHHCLTVFSSILFYDSMLRIASMSFEDIEDLDVGVNALVNDLWKSLVALPVTTMKRVTVNPVRGMCEVFAEFFFKTLV